jgi:hypothetical protein
VQTASLDKKNKLEFLGDLGVMFLNELCLIDPKSEKFLGRCLILLEEQSPQLLLTINFQNTSRSISALVAYLVLSLYIRKS